MTALSQRDPKWGSIPLGTSKTTTIHSHGCTITSLAYILKTTPDIVNKRLLEVGGYANTNLVIWEKLSTAFPQIQSVKRVRTYNNDEVAANLPCLVEVDGKRIGAPRHWVVYIGNQQMMDPWFGNFKATNYYPPVGYTIIKVKEADVSKELDACMKDRQMFWDERDEIFRELNTDSLQGARSALAGLRSRITDLGNKLGTSQAEVENKEEQVSRLKAELLVSSEDIKLLNIKLNECRDQVTKFAKEKGDLAIQLAKAEQAIESLKQGSSYPCHTPQWIELLFKYLRRRFNV